MSNDITDKLKLLPHSPGVYRFLDKEGKVIYVGKAKDLKKRVSSYFRPPHTLGRKTAALVAKIDDIITAVVDSEHDAFLLENNLIKEFQPKYNILLKDGKTYPWVCVRREPFPRVFTTRRFVRDGSLYFGPYSSACHAKSLVDLFEAMFSLRNCKFSLNEKAIAEGKFRRCLNFHLGKCLAPCTGDISASDYEQQIEQIIQILKGNSAGVIARFEKNMAEAAARLDFESAQVWKQRKTLLEEHYSKSLVAGTSRLDADVFNLVSDGSDAYGNYLRLRQGCIVQSLNLSLQCRVDEEPPVVLDALMRGIYERIGGSPSSVIIVPFMPESDYPGLVVPQKGDRLSLLELSRKNAAALKSESLKQEAFTSPVEHSRKILENLRRDLGMSELPEHIECFDNSNTQGTNPVASCVVFRDAAPSKKDYRHFNIRTVVGPDDFASMKEVVNRRYSRLLAQGEPLPQLVVVDGGKGQVHAAWEALGELGLLERIKLIGIAKRMEELIVPGDPYPLFLDKNSTSLRLIMQLRDEAHRFGITHHRNRRSAAALVSELDGIPGLGKVSVEKLNGAYATISKIRKAPYEELKQLLGTRAAKLLWEHFHQELPIIS